MKRYNIILPMGQRVLFMMVILCFSLVSSTQPLSIPRNYFINPLKRTMFLAANFGELRPDHWHMGLDIRTEQKENLPVYAAASGYISHIGIRPQSFGRFIVINHPNGFSTLYAHLNNFFPGLEDYVTAEQYKRESWAIELDLSPDQFPVTQGSFIAFSGNTGGSQGPHLHFEIFNSRTRVRYNPLLFGLPMQDQVAPDLVRLAMYDRSRSVYDQTPAFFSLKKTEKGYRIPKTGMIRTGLKKLSFAIQAYDRMSGSNNKDGIFSAFLFLDGNVFSGFRMDSVGYDESAYVNAQIDYKYKYNGGAYFQHLAPLRGDQGPEWRNVKNGGVIELNDTAIHDISIEVKDAYGNTSLLSFQLELDNSLSAPNQPGTGNTFSPGRTNIFERPGFEVFLGKDAIYDSIEPVYFRNYSFSPTLLSSVHVLNDASIPLHEEIIVRIKLEKLVPFDWQDKLIIQRTDRKTKEVKRATWEDKWLSAKFGDFGSFQLLADTIAPELKAPASLLRPADTLDLSAGNRIVLTPSDNLGVVRRFRAELDGKWIRFSNDKAKNWVYEFDERCPFGTHRLRVTLEDLVGNCTTREWWFTRHAYTPPKKKVSRKHAAAKHKTGTKKGKK